MCRRHFKSTKQNRNVHKKTTNYHEKSRDPLFSPKCWVEMRLKNREIHFFPEISMEMRLKKGRKAQNAWKSGRTSKKSMWKSWNCVKKWKNLHKKHEIREKLKIFHWKNHIFHQKCSIVLLIAGPIISQKYTPFYFYYV